MQWDWVDGQAVLFFLSELKALFGVYVWIVYGIEKGTLL